MSEEVDQIVEEVAEEQPKPARRTRKPKADDGPKRVLCTSEVTGQLYDPTRNVTIPPAGQNPVEIDGNIKEGSWLDVQIKAGLVEVR